MLFCFVFCSPFSIAITSLGEERANLSVFRTICACLSVSSSSWCLGWAAASDCGTPWTFPLLFLQMCSFGMELREQYTPGRSSALFHKTDNVCAFLFAFLHIKSLMKRSLLQEEQILSPPPLAHIYPF